MNTDASSTRSNGHAAGLSVEPPIERSDRGLSRGTSNSGCLMTKAARNNLPRYRRRDRTRGSRATIYAFPLRRVPHWILRGPDWIGHMSDAEFRATYQPSNEVARIAWHKEMEWKN